MIVIDFETEAIVGNPVVNPPRPVGVAVWWEGYDPHYMVEHDMLVACREAWYSDEPLLFHNASFDLSVARKWLGLEIPDWRRIHDTMFLLFLKDPYGDLGLKPAANRYLGMLPDEQSAVRAWVLSHVQGATEKTWGAYISKAPVSLVAPYAIGDVERTGQLFQLLRPQVDVGAYNRERRLLPILMRSSRQGIRVHRPQLTNLLDACGSGLKQADCRLRVALNAPTLEVSSNRELAHYLDTAGMLSHRVMTAKGNQRVAKEVLIETVTDKAVLDLILYRNAMETCLGFMRSWEEKSRADGRVHTEWNQVRSFERGHQSGTRTGRLSAAAPNFQNVPTEYKVQTPPGLVDIPYLRTLYLPEDGHRWLKRDFSAQEIRITAHYEDGRLLEAYVQDPGLDPHQFALDLILSITGLRLERKQVKIIAFSIVYGSGVTGLSNQMKCPMGLAAAMKEAYFKAFPGIRDLIKSVSKDAKAGMPIHTWGGRVYYAEEGFEYKLLNYLIQGSAADQTKDCINCWDEVRSADDVFLATVHDEINISAPEDSWKESMECLRTVMNGPRFDTPMQTDGFAGSNWHDLKEVA